MDASASAEIIRIPSMQAAGRPCSHTLRYQRTVFVSIVFPEVSQQLDVKHVHLEENYGDALVFTPLSTCAMKSCIGIACRHGMIDALVVFPYYRQG